MTNEDVKARASLFMKLSKVMAALDRIPKTGFNKFQKYSFATDSDVADAIRPLLAEHNVFLFSSMIDVTSSMFERNNKQQTHTLARFTFTFCDGETGATWTSEWFGESEDTGDKGVNKAATSALKYFLLKTFILSTGDPADEADSGVSSQPTPQMTPKPTSKQQRRAPQKVTMSRDDFIAEVIRLGIAQDNIGHFLQEHDILIDNGIDRYEQMLELVKEVLSDMDDNVFDDIDTHDLIRDDSEVA